MRNQILLDICVDFVLNTCKLEEKSTSRFTSRFEVLTEQLDLLELCTDDKPEIKEIFIQHKMIKVQQQRAQEDERLRLELEAMQYAKTEPPAYELYN